MGVLQRALQRDAERSAGWFEDVERRAHLDPLAFGYSLRTRKTAPADGGQEVRGSALEYGLHRATQWRVGRAARDPEKRDAPVSADRVRRLRETLDRY